MQPRTRLESIRSLLLVIPCGRREGAGSGSRVHWSTVVAEKGQCCQNPDVQSCALAAWKTGWARPAHGFEDGGSDAGCGAGNTLRNSSSSLPTPQRHVCAAQGLEIPGAWIPRFWECCSSGVVSLSGSFCFLEISRFGFSKARQRQVGAHLQGIQHPTCVPCAEPFREPGSCTSCQHSL